MSRCLEFCLPVVLAAMMPYFWGAVAVPASSQTNPSRKRGTITPTTTTMPITGPTKVI